MCGCYGCSPRCEFNPLCEIFRLWAWAARVGLRKMTDWMDRLVWRSWDSEGLEKDEGL